MSQSFHHVHHHHHHPNFPEQEQNQEQPPDSSSQQTLASFSFIPICSNNTIIHDDDDDDHDDHLYAFDFDPHSPPNTYFFSSPNHPLSLSGSEPADSDSDDQMDFITDLFASRGEEYAGEVGNSVTDGANSRVFEGSVGFGSNFDEEEELGFGSGSPSRFSSFRVDLSTVGGLRVVGIDSESDSEEVGQDVNSRGVHVDDAMTSHEPFGDSDGFPFFWDCLGFEEQGASGRTEELVEWEEVEGAGGVDDGGRRERESLSSVIDRIEELSVSSEISSNDGIGEEVVRSLEWEILLAVNNLGRTLEFDQDGNIDGVPYLAVRDGVVDEAGYEEFFGQFVQSESALKGSPPASKAVVENLPCVVLTEEELRVSRVVCAVCKDEISVEEEVTRLPCRHHYHGDCIVPWLCIRNTCPVCRYELPTDDMEYEQRKTRGQDMQIL